MKGTFRIRVCGDLDYEEMVADIVWNDCTVALITQESGPSEMKIEIFNPPNEDSWKFPLDDFVRIIGDAQKQLLEMQKYD